MLPSQLAPDSFRAYPPEARRIAAGQIALLRRLPLGFVPLLLRELILWDWKFPAERKDLDRQFSYLNSLSPKQLAKAMELFSQLRLAPALEKVDWVNSPGIFTEQLTAHLWSTHQIDAFRTAAVAYVAESSGGAADVLPTHRLGIAVIGLGVGAKEYQLFRKLRAHGTHFTGVRQTNGLDAILEVVTKRAAAHPFPYGHWFIDGGSAALPPAAKVAHISYEALAASRAALQGLMQKIYESAVFDPEAFRTRMALMRPEEIRLDTGSDAVLNRFQLSLLTEGSGTQVFATTFVQWAAREAWRRAQPLTLLARFTPRQRENPMNELLAEARRHPQLDPQGSLVDADMGAYYTWLNQQRLPGAEKAAFLVWFEDQQEALAIGPGIERDKRSDAVIELGELIAQVA